MLLEKAVYQNVLINFLAFKEKKIAVQQTMDSVKEKYNKLVGILEDRGQVMMEKWKEKSNEFVQNFIAMYGAMVS